MRVLIALFSIVVVLTSCSEEEPDPTPLASEYKLDGTVHEIITRLYWDRSVGPGEEDQLRLEQQVSGGAETDMIVFIPVMGSGSFEGSYVYSKTGDIRTYNVVYVRNIDNNNFEWITNGDLGSNLDIMRIGSEDGEPVYNVILEDFDLNYGYYDFLGDKWVSLGTKKFRFQYQGTIKD